MPFLNINPTFRDLVRHLDEEEFSGLERQILKWGVREPLVTWNGYLVDGHHRYKICSKHGLKFQTVEYHFENEDAAGDYILENQLDKRNVTYFEKVEIIKKLEERRLQRAAKDRQGERTDLTDSKATPDNVPHNCGERKDREKEVDRQLAEKAGVSHQTIHKASKIIDFGSEELKQQLRDDKVSIDAAYRNLKAEEAGHEDKFPKESYRVFYADFFEQDCSAGWEPIENFSDLKNIPVRDHHNNKDGICFLWSSLIELQGTLSVMRAWGFCYETLFILENDRKFEDLYNSSDHMVVVVGAGKDGSVPDIKHRLSSGLDKSMAGDHRVSEFRKLIDQMYTSGNKIQLFSNNKTPEWDVFK
jgi:ParB-like chromosome segregation protein Spo0J/N6-adenosine-specific RNA methylase IME4